MPLHSKIEIIPATWRDLGSLQELEKKTFPKDAWPLWDLIGILTLPNLVRLKAVLDHEFAGFVAMEYKSKDQANWIATIGVLPAYQHGGIGSVLMDACEPLAKSGIIRLCVRASNDAAQKLYLKAGYQSVDIWHKYYFDEEDAFVMEKRLAKRKFG
jgi:ribosomal-protein-alanine N-acetyltransferase